MPPSPLPSSAPPLIEVGRRGPGEVLLEVRGTVDRRTVAHLRRELQRLLDTGVTSMTVDLSEVPHCDYRVLAMLDDVRRRLQTEHARFTLLGLDPQVLTGFARASLRDVLAAYRASPGVAYPLWPGEPTGLGKVPGRYTDAERVLARVCVGLVSSRRHEGWAGAVDVGGRLTAECVRHLGVDAAVLVLVTPDRPGEKSVVSASAEGARSVARMDVQSGYGPATNCLRTGEPCCVPDLTEGVDAWPRLVEAALSHGLRAARALPLRQPRPGMPGTSSTTGADTIGVLGLFNSAAGPMAPADLGVAQAFADLAALALMTGSGSRHIAEADTARPTA
jgi:anti-anti-sigma regulatory factor